MIGMKLDDKYEILELIGQGGMACVYKAHDLRLDRFVAVKVLKAEFMDNEQFLKKFLREAQADAKLAHPNIVNVYDVGSENGTYYIVMEYIDGKTLKDYIRAQKRIPPEECAELCVQIADALRHAHENNIIHRDIKPHNILMTSGKIPKVADFGIARAITSSTITATQEALGSVHYISPEQARGGFLDERSDLYSFGIMMYEMLTGELPYEGETPVAVALQHVQNDVPSPKNKVKGLPDNICQVVLNLTRRKPDDRYQNAQEVIDDLNKIIQEPSSVIAPTYSAAAEDALRKKVKPERTRISTAKNDRRRKSGMLIGWIMTACVLLFGLSYYALTHWFKKVEVPPLANTTLSAAVLELEKVGLHHEEERIYDLEIPKDVVISSTPEAGTIMRVGEHVKLLVSNGPKIGEIPDVTSNSQLVAESRIHDEGFVVEAIIRVNSDEYMDGTVCDQSPKGGVKAIEGTGVTLYISKGKDTVIVPRVIGKSLQDGKDELTSNNLIAGTVTYEISDSVEKGKIVRQSVTAYTEVEKNTVVDLVVSLGGVVTKTMTFDLSQYTAAIPDNPDGTTGSVEVKVVVCDTDGSNSSGVYSNTCLKNESITVEFKGVGSKIYKLYINEEEKYSGVIIFS